jgi:hypothetical protein
MMLLHGTSSSKAESIRKDGFLPGSCFTTNVDDALYYAATGGEEDLQRREEEWEADNGYPPREEYVPDLWQMFEHLYPQGDRPVIVIIELDAGTVSRGVLDNGAEGGVRFEEGIPAAAVVRIVDVNWANIDEEGYDPTQPVADQRPVIF